jgi:hypothetical protein
MLLIPAVKAFNRKGRKGFAKDAKKNKAVQENKAANKG